MYGDCALFLEVSCPIFLVDPRQEYRVGHSSKGTLACRAFHLQGMRGEEVNTKERLVFNSPEKNM